MSLEGGRAPENRRAQLAGYVATQCIMPYLMTSKQAASQLICVGDSQWEPNVFKYSVFSDYVCLKPSVLCHCVGFVLDLVAPVLRGRL